jgi:hypothetical protein
VTKYATDILNISVRLVTKSRELFRNSQETVKEFAGLCCSAKRKVRLRERRTGEESIAKPQERRAVYERTALGRKRQRMWDRTPSRTQELQRPNLELDPARTVLQQFRFGIRVIRIEPEQDRTSFGRLGNEVRGDPSPNRLSHRASRCE